MPTTPRIDLLALLRQPVANLHPGAGAVQSATLSFDTFVKHATIGAENAFSDAAQGLSLDVDNAVARDLLTAGADAFDPSR